MFIYLGFVRGWEFSSPSRPLHRACLPRLDLNFRRDTWSLLRNNVNVGRRSRPDWMLGSSCRWNEDCALMHASDFTDLEKSRVAFLAEQNKQTCRHEIAYVTVIPLAGACPWPTARLPRKPAPAEKQVCPPCMLAAVRILL